MKAILTLLMPLTVMVGNEALADNLNQQQMYQQQQQQQRLYQQQQEQQQRIYQQQRDQQRDRDIQRREYRFQQQMRSGLCPTNDYRCR